MPDTPLFVDFKLVYNAISTTSLRLIEALVSHFYIILHLVIERA